MEVKEEVRPFPGTVVMQGHFGPVSGAGVLSTKVRVLLRPGGVEGHPGKLGTTSVVSSCVCFRAFISA